MVFKPSQRKLLCECKPNLGRDISESTQVGFILMTNLKSRTDKSAVFGKAGKSNANNSYPLSFFTNDT